MRTGLSQVHKGEICKMVTLVPGRLFTPRTTTPMGYLQATEQQQDPDVSTPPIKGTADSWQFGYISSSPEAMMLQWVGICSDARASESVVFSSGLHFSSASGPFDLFTRSDPSESVNLSRGVLPCGFTSRVGSNYGRAFA